ncbi:MAG: 2Fe-2S iron-sulfur cluster-binding protein [Pseudomonadota bacterium]
MSHQIHLAHSDIRFDAAENETVLAAGLRQGLALPFGCQSGGCGSCRVRCISGHVHHIQEPLALSEAELDAGYLLMCLAQPRSNLELDLYQPARLEELRPHQLPARVIEKRLLAHDVISLSLQLPKEPAFKYLPGQYVDFLLADGRRRSFSIANAGGTQSLQLDFHLRITPDGRFAHYVQNDMPGRTVLHLEGPLGAFYLREDSQRPVLMMAGGTGFAPIQAMLESAFASGTTRTFHLFWGARAERDLYLDTRAREWARLHKNFSYTPVLSAPDAGWVGERGLVHETLLKSYPDLAGHEIYIAGPPVMVHAAKHAFTEAGLDADHLFYDSFDYAFETWPGKK